MRVGAHYLGDDSCLFTAWAPFVTELSLRITAPKERVVPMNPAAGGYWQVRVEDVGPGTRYLYRLDGDTERPDPASHFQPSGVHGPSCVVDHSAFVWEDGLFRGIALKDMVIYELHVGTFTPEGTFDAIIPRIGTLLETGINTLELMPVAQFPGGRNWGYDGAYPYAVQDSYGGPDSLKLLVNACHRKGMAVILDVVYNHLGPEGNYLESFGPYFTEKYLTPWGKAVNFDDAYSNEVRNFFIENALHWFGNYHLDGLRLDAVHGMTDMSATPFLRELALRTAEFSKERGRHCYLIAESDLNDSRVIRPAESGGFSLDAQWCDDFHHALHALLTGEKEGYYLDFGGAGDLAKAMRDGYVFSGAYSAFRKRNHGNRSSDRPADQFILSSQNHDQVGNRMLGERLSSLMSIEGIKLAAGAVTLSPGVPLLFMGEEYGEDAPFLYFVSHSDPDLIEAVRKGRKAEFGSFSWKGEPPDPQSPETFLNSKIFWEKRRAGRYRVMADLYRKLLSLRRESPALMNTDRDNLEVCGIDEERIIFLRRWKGTDQRFCVFHFGGKDLNLKLPFPEGRWVKMLDSADTVWAGPGSLLPQTAGPGERVTLRALSFALYRRQETA